MQVLVGLPAWRKTEIQNFTMPNSAFLSSACRQNIDGHVYIITLLVLYRQLFCIVISLCVFCRWCEQLQLLHLSEWQYHDSCVAVSNAVWNYAVDYLLGILTDSAENVKEKPQFKGMYGLFGVVANNRVYVTSVKWLCRLSPANEFMMFGMFCNKPGCETVEKTLYIAWVPVAMCDLRLTDSIRLHSDTNDSTAFPPCPIYPFHSLACTFDSFGTYGTIQMCFDWLIWLSVWVHQLTMKLHLWREVDVCQVSILAPSSIV